MEIQPAGSQPNLTALNGADELATLVQGGSLDSQGLADALSAAGPDGVATLLRSLPPADQGFLQGLMTRQGLGHLLQGVGHVAEAPGQVADAAVYTPKEQQQDQVTDAYEQSWLQQMQAQSELDRALVAFIKTDRPVAAEAAAVSLKDPHGDANRA